MSLPQIISTSVRLCVGSVGAGVTIEKSLDNG